MLSTYSMTIEQCKEEMSRIRGTSVQFGDNYKWNELQRDYAELKNRIMKLEQEAGNFLTANPEKAEYGYFDKEGKDTWYSGADYGPLFRLLPDRYRDEGAYGLHEWLENIDALTKGTYHDHEMGMVCYYFKTKQAAENHVTRINKVLKELKDKGII